MSELPEAFLSDITWRHLRGYFRGTTSLFRRYQTQFLARHGADFTGDVVELGGDRRYRHERFFPNARRFVLTNVKDDDVDLRLDVTDLRELQDDSQDAYLCVSVLEHVRDPLRALAEIHRTLRPGGRLLLTVPFAYPHHDLVDYWRIGRDAYKDLFPGYRILELARLGGTFSTLTDILQRPKGDLRRRYLVYKTLGLVVGVLGMRLDTPDGLPLGYGLYARKT